MKNYLKKLALFFTVTFLLLMSCSKSDDEIKPVDEEVYTGYYNLKDKYNGDLLLKIVNTKESVSYYGSTNELGKTDILASLYKNNSTGKRIIYKINSTRDTSILYDFDKPDLGGILVIRKETDIVVQEFEFLEDNKSIRPTKYIKSISNKVSRLKQSKENNDDKQLKNNDDSLKDFIDTAQSADWFDIDIEIPFKGMIDGFKKGWNSGIDYLKDKLIENPGPIQSQITEDPDPNPNIDSVKPLEKIPYFDCHKDLNGKAIYDECQRCIYGNTGLNDYCHCETSGLELSVSYKAYSATLTPSGGSGSYQFEWLHIDSLEATAINLVPGKDYYGTVIDLKTSCRKSVTINVKGCEWPNSTLALTISSTTNSATVNPIGGQAPYNFLWSNGSVEKTATNLMPGTYTVTVTDDFGCSITSTVNIGCANSTLTVTTSTTANSATAIATGGQAPYSFLWSNGSTQQIATNLTAGDYIVTVNDALKCVKTVSATVVASVFNYKLEIGDYNPDYSKISTIKTLSSGDTFSTPNNVTRMVRLTLNGVPVKVGQYGLEWDQFKFGQNPISSSDLKISNYGVTVYDYTNSKSITIPLDVTLTNSAYSRIVGSTFTVKHFRNNSLVGTQTISFDSNGRYTKFYSDGTSAGTSHYSFVSVISPSYVTCESYTINNDILGAISLPAESQNISIPNYFIINSDNTIIANSHYGCNNGWERWEIQ